MIQVVCSTLKDRLESTEMVERLAGLVTPVSYEGRSYPIASDVDGAECFETGRYKDLIPNDKFKSVIYFEDRGGFRFLGFTQKYNMTEWEGTVRLVAWLNLAKLGITDPAVTDRVLFTIADKLLEEKGFHQITATGWGDNAKLRVSIVGTAQRDSRIFSPYSYSEMPKLLVYPYDFFAIDLRVTVMVGRSCFTSVVDGADINCPTY